MHTTIPHVDALTIHSDFLRRMARALLRSPDQADDLVQDTFVVAMQKEPKDAETVRPWLLGIMRNQLRNRRRGAKRRHDRHRRGARPEALPATAELIEKEDIRRRVVDALMSLDEPLRTTMVLRFYEHLPPRDVALRMECPVETVRTRTRRGLDRMRSTLDDGHDGDRKKWMAALMPWALPPSVATAGAAAATSVWFKATAAVVLVGVAGFFGWRISQDGGQSPVLSNEEAPTRARTDNRAAPILVGTRQAHATNAPAVRPRRTAKPSANATRIRFANVDGPIRPAGFLRVVGMWNRGDGKPQQPELDRRALHLVELADVLGEDGSFTVDILWALTDPVPHALMLEVEHPDFVPTSRVVALTPKHDDDGNELRWFHSRAPNTRASAVDRLTADPIAIRMRSLLEGTVLAARVVDEQDQPVATWPYHLTTVRPSGKHERRNVYARADGTLRWRDDEAKEITLIVKVPGFETIVRTARMTSGRTTDLGTLKLSRGASMHGTVSVAGIDPRGLFIRARQQSLPSDSAQRRKHYAKVGSDGTFEMSGLSRDRRYRFFPAGSFGNYRIHEWAEALLSTDFMSPEGRVDFDLDRMARIEVSCEEERTNVNLRLTAHVDGLRLPGSVEMGVLATSTWFVAPETRHTLRTRVGSVNLEQDIAVGGPGSTVAVRAMPAHASLRLRLHAYHRQPTSVSVVSYPTTSDEPADAQFDRLRKATDIITIWPVKNSDIITIWPLESGRRLIHVVPTDESRAASCYAPVNFILDVPDEGIIEHDLDVLRGGRFALRFDDTEGHFIGRLRIRRTGSEAWRPIAMRQGDQPLPRGLVLHPATAHSMEALAEGDYEIEWRLNNNAPEVHSLAIVAGQTPTLQLRTR